MKYDFAVIGAGPAGYVAAKKRIFRARTDADRQIAVIGIDDEYGIAALSFPCGEFLVTAPGLEAGDRLRIRVRARDVSLATKRPQDVSVLNVFEGTVVEITDTGQPQADVSVDVGGATVWSQITRKSLDDLAIRPGSTVYAMIKAVAIDRPAGSP